MNVSTFFHLNTVNVFTAMKRKKDLFVICRIFLFIVQRREVYLSLFVYRATDFLRIPLFTLCICFFFFLKWYFSRGENRPPDFAASQVALRWLLFQYFLTLSPSPGSSLKTAKIDLKKAQIGKKRNPPTTNTPFPVAPVKFPCWKSLQ